MTTILLIAGNTLIPMHVARLRVVESTPQEIFTHVEGRTLSSWIHVDGLNTAKVVLGDFLQEKNFGIWLKVWPVCALNEDCKADMPSSIMRGAGFSVSKI
jgi:hypothetical protein